MNKCKCKCLRSTHSAFQWTDEAQTSFENVKSMLLDSQALALFDPTLRTIVSTDASDYGIGGVLSQVGSDSMDMDIRHRVGQRQHKMKTYTDARPGARPPAFQKGDRVRGEKSTTCF